jgi:hypothetical protein
LDVGLVVDVLCKLDIQDGNTDLLKVYPLHLVPCLIPPSSCFNRALACTLLLPFVRSVPMCHVRNIIALCSQNKAVVAVLAVLAVLQLRRALAYRI